MFSVILKLEGLDCAHCAQKLQEKVKKLCNVEKVNVNIISQQINIEYDNINEDKLISQVEGISKSLGVNIINNKKIEYTGISYKNLDITLKLKLVRYSIGLLIYFIAILANVEHTLVVPLYIVSYIIFGADIILKATKSIIRGDVFNENFLMSVASIGAIYIGMLSEAVAVMLFFQIGEFFQDMAISRSRKSIKDLMDIKADYANIIVNEEINKVDPTEVKIGDIILVKPGEKVPLDGIVIQGISQIDASSLIGESVPRNVKPNDEIMSGVINLTGTIVLKVTKDYSNSTISKIFDMMESASSKKATTERFITQFAKIYTPIVIFIALLLMFVPPFIISNSNSNQWIYKGLVFLLVSCPCALHLSVPLSFFSGIGNSSKNGILIKGSSYLQVLSNISIVVFDKTGTLTKGVFTVTNIYPKKGLTENQVLEIAGSIEKFSNHPIAKSIINECDKRNINIKNKSVANFKEIHGKGLRANLNGKKVFIGNEKLMKFINVQYEEYNGMGTVIHVAENNKYIGLITISDVIKEDSKLSIQKLKQMGIKNTVMLSGDRKESAYKVSKNLGIDETYAELLPNQKVEIIEDLYNRYPGKKIAFVGDGINDAPVLSRVDVGIAMGGIGSDAAIESADIVIMTDELLKIPMAINISKITMNIVKQNIILIVCIKFIVLTLTILGYGNIWLAVLADTGATLIAVLNSIRKKTP